LKIKNRIQQIKWYTIYGMAPEVLEIWKSRQVYWSSILRYDRLDWKCQVFGLSLKSKLANGLNAFSQAFSLSL